LRSAQIECAVKLPIVLQRGNGCLSQVAQIKVTDPRIAQGQKNRAG